ncbi:MAG: 50S ribosomal protein L10 [Alphaproteobacteria bacterium]|nr:50S ribosomal protein L10 [Alphaproteobacteria bacterium]
MNREQKQELISSLNGLFSQTAIVVVTHYKGLTVAEMTDLRNQVREVGASFRVTQNRLTRLALKGTEYENLSDLFTGPTAIAYSDDPVAAAKVAVSFAKKNDKLIIQGAAMGDMVLDDAGIKNLASLPSLDELRAKIISVIQTPATRIAGVTQAPASQLARVLKAYADKDEAA